MAARPCRAGVLNAEPGGGRASGAAQRRRLDLAFGNRPVVEIRETHVRRWRKELLDSGASATSVAKAYRLLSAIMNTAVDDAIIRRNPCRIRGRAWTGRPNVPC